jgi:penicillin-binding protein 1A
VNTTLFSWNREVDTLISPRDSVIYNKFFLHTGVMSMDPNTGHVKAYVGGINHKYFQYDHVLQGSRQVGSTFKPFLYSLAIQEGMDPCDKILNSPVVFDKDKWGLPKDWIPKNTSPEFD